MTDFRELERAAGALRHCLREASLPELKVLCGLRFLQLLSGADPRVQEPFLREFIPALATAAAKSRPEEFLPSEADQLGEINGFLKSHVPALVMPKDSESLLSLADRVTEYLTIAPASSIVETIKEEHNKDPHDISLRCLFVEHHPELGLEARGRILTLRVRVTAIPAKLPDDDIVIRNPLLEPDDSFRQQALQSVVAARQHLSTRYGLSTRKRYRCDFDVDSTGARFTGDSLGVPFAIGAIVGFSRQEVFRDRLSVAQDVAFSGALLAEGNLQSIDPVGLQLKIQRAFHSPLRYLVIPRAHLIEALKYERELETQFRGRRLELVGADTLDQVATDPRLVPPDRSSPIGYAARKVWQTKRSPLLEVPMLLALLAILYVLIAPASWMPWFDDNPYYAEFLKGSNSLDAFNKDSVFLWSNPMDCELMRDSRDPIVTTDINGDGLNEVLYIPLTRSQCGSRGWLHCLDFKGKVIFTRYCAIRNEYLGDTSGISYEADHLSVAEVNRKLIIITEVYQQNPTRSHIRLWSVDGDSLGWYINSGASKFHFAMDFNADGRDELYFLNYANLENAIALLVVDPDSCFGVGPPYTTSSRRLAAFLSASRRARQLAYLVFPMTDVGTIELPCGMNQPTNMIYCDSSSIAVYSSESFGDANVQMIYYVNPAFRVTGVLPTDQFNTKRRRLVEEGELSVVDEDTYKDACRDAVRHWTDSGWVTEGQLRALDK